MALQGNNDKVNAISMHFIIQTEISYVVLNSNFFSGTVFSMFEQTQAPVPEFGKDSVQTAIQCYLRHSGARKGGKRYKGNQVYHFKTYLCTILSLIL